MPCTGERMADLRLLRNAGDYGVSDPHQEVSLRRSKEGFVSEGQTPLVDSET
jgi:hypothetical protein